MQLHSSIRGYSTPGLGCLVLNVFMWGGGEFDFDLIGCLVFGFDFDFDFFFFPLIFFTLSLKQNRILLLCAQHNLRTSKVIETISKLAREAENQTTRRIALDCLAFIFLVGTNQVILKLLEIPLFVCDTLVDRWM